MSGDELRRTFVDLLRWVRERVDPDEAGGLPAEAAMDSLSPGSAASAEGSEEPAAPSELPAPPRDEADVALDRAGSPASGEPPSPEPAVPDVDPSAGPLTEPSTGPSA
ncbi:MAG TPA: hypothetical protein PKA64_22715, partial [Myxococcota bacterium]|nr:hypothetical protein [Myxococcota bacterium]